MSPIHRFIHKDRRLEISEFALAFVDSPLGSRTKRIWVRSSDFPQLESGDSEIRIYGLSGFPDARLSWEDGGEGFLRLKVELKGRGREGLHFEGHRIRLSYFGQTEAANRQSFYAYHSFAFNGVRRERRVPPRLRDGAPPFSRTTRLLYKEITGLAWWVTSLQSEKSPKNLFLAAETAENLKSTFTIQRLADRHEVTIYQGLRGDYLPASNLTADPILIRMSDAAFESFELYGERAARLIKAGAEPKARRGWASWYEYYPRIDEATMVEQAGKLAEKLRPSGFDLFQVDDGYQRAVGDWEHSPRLFPQGLPAVARNLTEKGLTPGIWFAPYLVERSSRVATSRAQEDWFLHGFDGRRLTYVIPRHSHNFILDVTNPEVRVHLRQISCGFRDAGFKFIKIDFLFLQAAEARRFDPAIPALTAYREGARLIREAVGPSVEILHSGSIDLAGAGEAHSARTGPDIAYDAFGGHTRVTYIKSQMLATAAHVFSAHRWFAPDPDAMLLRMPLLESLAEVMIAHAAMTGGNFLVSDDLDKVPSGRLEKLKHPFVLEMCRSKARLLALDFYEGHQCFQVAPNPLMMAPLLDPPRIWLWRDSETGRQALLLFNLDSNAFRFRRSLEELCVRLAGKVLVPDVRARDIFHGSCLEVKKGLIDLEVPAYSVRIFPLA